MLYLHSPPVWHCRPWPAGLAITVCHPSLQHSTPPLVLQSPSTFISCPPPPPPPPYHLGAPISPPPLQPPNLEPSPQPAIIHSSATTFPQLGDGRSWRPLTSGPRRPPMFCRCTLHPKWRPHSVQLYTSSRCWIKSLGSHGPRSEMKQQHLVYNIFIFYEDLILSPGFFISMKWMLSLINIYWIRFISRYITMLVSYPCFIVFYPCMTISHHFWRLVNK